jgi:hypothetical protein
MFPRICRYASSPRARSSVDRALVSGTRGRRFESCRARLAVFDEARGSRQRLTGSVKPPVYTDPFAAVFSAGGSVNAVSDVASVAGGTVTVSAR